MNRIDTTGKEHLIATREPTGRVKQYNTKVILNTFGNYTQTAIMNSIPFTQPLTKLDRISFTLIDQGGNIINNADCEWNASLHITESIESTIGKISKTKNISVAPITNSNSLQEKN